MYLNNLHTAEWFQIANNNNKNNPEQMIEQFYQSH